mmetsp:Transcript_17918/g.38123  ORF Transcript_17918/g.38123 Transcript_17918/m.38123 type:complete len:210 (-) Transcript_17918:1808-2437(-)
MGFDRSNRSLLPPLSVSTIVTQSSQMRFRSPAFSLLSKRKQDRKPTDPQGLLFICSVCKPEWSMKASSRTSAASGSTMLEEMSRKRNVLLLDRHSRRIDTGASPLVVRLPVHWATESDVKFPSLVKMASPKARKATSPKQFQLKSSSSILGDLRMVLMKGIALLSPPCPRPVLATFRERSERWFLIASLRGRWVLLGSAIPLRSRCRNF